MCAIVLAGGDVVNIGSNRTYSVGEIAPLLGHRAFEMKTDPRRLRRLDVECFQCDSTKLRERTGWAPVVGLREGLELTVR